MVLFIMAILLFVMAMMLFMVAVLLFVMLAPEDVPNPVDHDRYLSSAYKWCRLLGSFRRVSWQTQL